MEPSVVAPGSSAPSTRNGSRVQSGLSDEMPKTTHSIVWYCHVPNAPGRVSEASTKPISQIPLLNDLPPESVDNEKKRVGKKSMKMPDNLGKKADILSYSDEFPVNREPKPYALADWFYHDVGGSGHEQSDSPRDSSRAGTTPVAYHDMAPAHTPHWMQHDADVDHRAKDPVAYPMRPPFSIDSDNVINGGARKPRARRNKTQTLPEIQHKPINHSADGPFENLMAHTYQQDFLQSLEDKKVAARVERVRLAQHKLDLDASAMRCFRRNRKQVVPEKKEPFFLSKFKNVPPKVNTFRSPNA